MNPEESTVVAEIVKHTLKDAYTDALQPASKEIGKGLRDVAKLLRAPLRVLGALAGPWNEYWDQFEERLKSRLAGVPEERLQPPPSYVAVPVLIGLAGAEHSPPLRDLYLELLARAMDREEARRVHPAFAGVVGHLSPDEARLIPLLTPEYGSWPVRCARLYKRRSRGQFTEVRVLTTLAHLEEAITLDYREGLSTYLSNLERLGLLSVDWNSTLASGDRWNLAPEYELVKSEPEWLSLLAEDHEDFVWSLGGEGPRIAGQPVNAGVARATSFGRAFAAACLETKGEPDAPQAEE